MKKYKSKIINVILVVLLFVSSTIKIISYANTAKINTQQVKKVISIVYDDSGSMSDNGQDYSYASYGLQNIIALMNKQDKLSVVKMSDMNTCNMFHIDNYDKRKSELEDVKGYLAEGKDTNFQTVKTAVNYLLEQKSMYGEDSSYEYYLILLTDGKFDNYPSNMVEYLSDVPRQFGSSVYNGIFIGIGKNVPEKLEKDVLSAPNNYYIKSGNNDEIVNALFVAHDIIYDRIVIPEEELLYNENQSSLVFDAKYDIGKVIVFEQNQQTAVTSITTPGVEANEKLIFTGIKKVAPTLDSYVVHASNTITNLPKDTVTLNFLDDIDKSKEKLRVMVEYVCGDNGEKISNILQESEAITPIPANPIIESEGLGDPNISVNKSPVIVEPKPIEKEPTIPKPTMFDPVAPEPISPIDPIKPITTIGPSACGCTRCSLYPMDIGLGGCGCVRCSPMYIGSIPTPTPTPTPTSQPSTPILWLYSIISLILSILPFLIALALLYGYLKKPRFDTKEHAFEKYDGKTLVDTGSMIKVNKSSKILPYAPESGYGNDLFIKAAKKKDRVIIPKKYLTTDIRVDNQEIDITKDLQLFENTNLTKNVDGKIYKYVYRHHPFLEKNS